MLNPHFILNFRISYDKSYLTLKTFKLRKMHKLHKVQLNELPVSENT